MARIRATSPPPLPVNDIVRKSYQDLLLNREGLVRVGLVWLLVPVALETLADWTGAGEGLSPMSLIAAIVSFVGLSAIAVAWHRHVILGASLDWPMAPVDQRVARYIGFAFLVSLLSCIPAAAALLVTAGLMGGGAADTGLLTLLFAAGLVAAAVIAVRLQLVFPATAIGDGQMPLRRSWRLTAGNTVRLLVGLILTVLPVLLAAMLATLLGLVFTAIGAPRFGAFVSLLAGNGGGWLQAPLVAAFLSYCYLWFRSLGGTSGTLPRVQ
jgi:hypothetical protein